MQAPAITPVRALENETVRPVGLDLDFMVLPTVYVYGRRAVSLPLLIFVALDRNLFWLYVFAFIFGFTLIANMAPTVGIVRNHYGLDSTGALVGWLLLAHQIGGAVGTYLGGLIYKAVGGMRKCSSLWRLQRSSVRFLARG